MDGGSCSQMTPWWKFHIPARSRDFLDIHYTEVTIPSSCWVQSKTIFQPRSRRFGSRRLRNFFPLFLDNSRGAQTRATDESYLDAFFFLLQSQVLPFKQNKLSFELRGWGVCIDHCCWTRAHAWSGDLHFHLAKFLMHENIRNVLVSSRFSSAIFSRTQALYRANLSEQCKKCST